MNNCEELISVIVPIYKVERYLKKCVETIMNQTYSNLEIILVDDGSPDSCGVICEELAKKDSRIKVIHKNNGGLSDARNEGIRTSTGEYLLFVDSDDFISYSMIETLYKSIKKNNADMVACGYKKVFSSGIVEEQQFSVKNREEILTGEDATKRLLYLMEPGMVVAWNKLERRELWKNMEFPVGKQHEDDFTTYRLMYNSSKVVLINDPLYYYTQREDSIIGTGFSLKSIDKIEAYEKACAFFKEKNREFYLRAINLVLIMNKRCCEEVIRSEHPEKKEILKKLKKLGRMFYLKNFYNIKRGFKYHMKIIGFYFLM